MSVNYKGCQDAVGCRRIPPEEEVMLQGVSGVTLKSRARALVHKMTGYLNLSLSMKNLEYLLTTNHSSEVNHVGGK